MSSTRETRNVRFANFTKIYCIPTLDEMSGEQIAEIWANDEDNERAQLDVVSVIRYMRTGGDFDDEDDEHCTRGLEHMRTPEHLELERINRNKAIDAVLDAQSRTLDEAVIASASERNTQWARDIASGLGMSDAEWVDRFVDVHAASAPVVEEEEAEKGESDALFSTLRNAFNPSKEIRPSLKEDPRLKLSKTSGRLHLQGSSRSASMKISSSLKATTKSPTVFDHITPSTKSWKERAAASKVPEENSNFRFMLHRQEHSKTLTVTTTAMSA